MTKIPFCIECGHHTDHDHDRCMVCHTKNNLDMDLIETGGGCEHFYLIYPEYKLAVLINDENHKAPKDGADFDFGVYHLEKDGSMGDSVGDDFYATLENFELHSIYERMRGYLEGRGFEKIAFNPGFTGKIHFEKATDLYLWLEENEIQCPVTIQLHLEK